jgi:hypothetical protein
MKTDRTRREETQAVLEQIHEGYTALCGLLRECDNVLSCMTLGPRIKRRYQQLRRHAFHVLSMEIPMDGFKDTPEFAKRQIKLAEYAAIATHVDVIEITDDLRSYHDLLFSTLEEVFLTLDRRLVDVKKTGTDIYDRPGVRHGNARWDAGEILAKAGFRSTAKAQMVIDVDW